MKKVLFSLFTMSCIVCLISCQPQNTPSSDYSFPRKHILEHFTGEDCGYCPIGYQAIYDFTEAHSNYIWVSHHYGFGKDEYTIKGMSNIASIDGVSGAPYCALDRSAVKYEGGASTSAKPAFHPSYLYDMASVPADTTYASIVLETSYDKSSRELKVKATGAIKGDPQVEQLKLTILVTESGMAGHQKDYVYSFAGWDEYRHVHVPRAFLTNALGDTVNIVNNAYVGQEYTLAIDPAWNADNMSVVAYLTELKNRPIVQAEETPLVKGTNGANKAKPEGLKMTNPENDTKLADVVGASTLTLSDAVSRYYKAGTMVAREFQVTSADVYKCSRTSCVPFLSFTVLVPADKTDIPTSGTFELNVSDKVNTAMAGVVEGVSVYGIGSYLAMMNKTYFDQGSLDAKGYWLLNSGSITFTEKGFTAKAKSLAGEDFEVVYEGKYTDYGHIED